MAKTLFGGFEMETVKKSVKNITELYIVSKPDREKLGEGTQPIFFSTLILPQSP